MPLYSNVTVSYVGVKSIRDFPSVKTIAFCQPRGFIPRRQKAITANQLILSRLKQANRYTDRCVRAAPERRHAVVVDAVECAVAFFILKQ